MKNIFGGTICFALIFFACIAFAGSAIKINSASVDIGNENLLIQGINFDAFGPITVTIGSTLLQNCTTEPTIIECPLTGTPALSGEASYTVSISAGNSPHTNDDIDVFILPELVSQSCLPGSYVGCYSGDPATRNVGECQSGFSTCLSDGTWSSCEGEVLSAIETCDDQLDYDCDGQISNGCDECQVDSDCPGTTRPPTCNQPGSCQGTRIEIKCLNDPQYNYKTCQDTFIDDDSACDTSLITLCDPYVDVVCTGEVDQNPNPCANSCNTDTDCKSYAYCDNYVHQCFYKKFSGEICYYNNECLSNSCMPSNPLNLEFRCL